MLGMRTHVSDHRWTSRADCGESYGAGIAETWLKHGQRRAVTGIDFDWTTGELAEGLRCYRERQFWHAHEHWEAVWLRLEGRERLFLQALIQTTGAFHHLQRGNLVGTASLLRKALRRLDPLADEFGGIDVRSLRESLRWWVRAIEHDKPVSELLQEFRYPEIR